MRLQKSLNLLIRPRWEYVNIKNDGKSAANAGTVRAQLGFGLKRGPLRFYEENTLVVSYYDHYSPLDNTYELVPDEPRYRITQLWLAYTSKVASVKVGRQVINLDNQRFVGAVNWRQTPQTFDAARADVVIPSGLKTKLTLAYICDRQAVVSSLTTYKICGNAPISYSFLGHMTFQAAPALKGAVYGYHFRNFASAYGLNVYGKVPVSDFSLTYWAEYAHEIVHNKVKKLYGKSDYYHVNVGTNLRLLNGVPFLQLGYEHFGKYFVTPLATLHKFNGWADVFLKYTAASDTYGLNDYYFTLGYRNSAIGKLEGVFHKFRAAKSFPGGGKNFGTEIDLLYTKPLTKNLSFLLKFANYNADSDAKNAGIGDKDTTKAWVMLTYKFGATF